MFMAISKEKKAKWLGLSNIRVHLKNPLAKIVKLESRLEEKAQKAVHLEVVHRQKCDVKSVEQKG